MGQALTVGRSAKLSRYLKVTFFLLGAILVMNNYLLLQVVRSNADGGIMMFYLGLLFIILLEVIGFSLLLAEQKPVHFVFLVVGIGLQMLLITGMFGDEEINKALPFICFGICILALVLATFIGKISGSIQQNSRSANQNVDVSKPQKVTNK